MRTKTLCCIALLALLASLAGAQSHADLSGYTDTLVGAVQKEVAFNHQQLLALAEAARATNADLADVLAHVDQVEARVVQLDAGHGPTIRESMTATSDALAAEGWSVLVRVRTQDENQVEVLLRHSENRIHGLVALFLGEDGEAGFANVSGDLDMRQVMTLAANADALRQFLGILDDETEG